MNKYSLRDMTEVVIKDKNTNEIVFKGEVMTANIKINNIACESDNYQLYKKERL